METLNVLFPLLSTSIMFVFSLQVLYRWLKRRTLFFLFWGVGLAFFGVAVFAAAYLAVAPFSRLWFLVWYICGAALTSAWIGQGTLLLLLRRPWLRWLTTGLLVVGSAVMAVLLLQTPLDGSQAVLGEPVSLWYRNVFPPRGAALPRSLTPIFNVYGLVTMVGGALWSSYLFWRKRVMPSRVLGNVLIALGGLSIASGDLLTRFGAGQFIHIGELIAAALIYAGFLFAASPTPVKQPAPAIAGGQ
jgi:hypothetical protein